MFRRGLVFAGIVVFCFLVPGLISATEPSELNEAVLFFVNDPQQLTYTDINLLTERNKQYHQERKTLTEDQISKFFQSLQEHGVQDAGTGANPVKVGYVVQNVGTEIQGVIVLKGKFDKAKVLETLRKHYSEHSSEHASTVTKNKSFAKVHGETPANPYVEAEIKIDNHSAHLFPMPLQNRELIVVSTPDATLFSSATKGNRELLRKTLSVVEGKLPIKSTDTHSKVVMTFAPTSAEKKQMEEKIWARYDKQKQDSISKKKRVKKLGERIRQKVIRSKVDFFVEALENLQQGTLTIERDRENQMSKVATLITTHESAQSAADVKKRFMKHMVKEIKRNDNVQDKFALGNVSITTRDKQTVIRCQLKDSKEQLHAFNLISSYVAKGLLERL